MDPRLLAPALICCRSRHAKSTATVATVRSGASLTVVLLAGLLSAAVVRAQTEPLFLSDGDGDRLLVVQGGAIVNSFSAVPAQRAFPIAIIDQIRTTGYALGETGGEYTLAGAPTGATYPLGQGGNLSDGTTDGVSYNYAITYTGTVWRFDLNWAGGVSLFAATDHAGITYDHRDDTLWLSRDRDAGISHYDLAGTLLGSFPTVANLDWIMALEPSTGTLWVGERTTASLTQYAKDGTLLQTIPVSGMTPTSFFSAEFQIDRLPPTATITSATGTLGTALALSASLADYSRVASATLYYRQAGSAGTFASIAMSESPPGSRTWVGTIPPAIVTARGVQYYLELADVLNNTGTFPVGAPTTLGSASVVIANQRVVGLAAGQYALGALSFAASNATAEAIFDELGPYKKSVWRFGTYNPATGACAEPPDALAATPGRGFWVVSRDGGDIFTSGASSNVGTAATLTLGQGWNQVGNPFAFPVDVADMTIDTGVESNFVSWNGAQYTAGQTVLQPFTGYWVKNNGPGTKTIQIPPLASGAEPSPALPPGMLREDEPGWSVAMSATAGAFADRENRLGVRPGATNAKDAFDFSDPPPPPEGFVTLALIGDDETALMSDYRPESANGASWRLRLTSDQAGQPFRVMFDEERALPPGWRLVAYGPGGLREVDLSADGAITGTVGSAPFVREWTIAAGTPEWTQQLRTELQSHASAFSFSAPIPNPSRGPSFDLALPEAAHVDARVYDVTGRAVRTLVDTQLERGYHLLEWNGTDTSGGRVSSGVYFVRLRAGSHDESRKVVLLQ